MAALFLVSCVDIKLPLKLLYMSCHNEQQMYLQLSHIFLKFTFNLVVVQSNVSDVDI